MEGDSGEVSITETDWDKIEDLKEYVPNLYIPGYVPEGYEFEKATVEKYSDDMYKIEFTFIDNKKSYLSMIQASQVESGNKTLFLKESDEIYESRWGTVYISNHQKEYRAC